MLGVWAHPDDEAYLSAGLMTERRHRGERVVVLTATAGEHGTAHPERWPPHRLGAWRRDELRAVLAVLDVHEHHVLDLPDGGCADVDATARILDVVEAVRPDTIVTFGPDGMTGHPDHRAVSAWTTAAWEASGRRFRLWYATLTPQFHADWGAVSQRIGLFADSAGPPCVEERHLVHALRLDGAALDRKVAALLAHASQAFPLRALVGHDVYRQWWRTESFVDALTHRRLYDPELIGAIP